MPSEVLTLYTLVFAAIAAPGALLFGLARTRVLRVATLNRAAMFCGWLMIALAVSFLLVMQLSTLGTSEPGGLGSQGNPWAVVLLLAYGFVVAPLAWFTLIVFAILWVISRTKQAQR